MEVHHAHHPTHKKKWSEYLLEFFMLFFAVTLGFFAENVREHQVVIERKNQNLEAMVQDLRRDSIQIEERMKNYFVGLNDFEEIKYASLQYQKKEITEDAYINLVANKFDSLMVGISLFINNSAYKNTISTGSLSVIESTEVKQLIAEYYEELGVKLQDNNRNLDLELDEYIQKTFQFGNGFESEYRKSITKIPHKVLLNDFKNIPTFRKAMLDPAIRLYTHKFEGRCEYYLYVLDRFKEVNKKLLEALENKTKEKNGSTSSSKFSS
jgi:hypothetical protein